MITPSPYDPPRAGPWSRILARLERSAHRLRNSGSSLAGNSIHIHIPFLRVLPWLLIPGLMWRQLGRKQLGNTVVAIWTALVAVHVATLNPSLAASAAMLASILHAVSAAAVLSRLRPHWQGISGMIWTSLSASLLVFAIYSLGMQPLISPFMQRMTIGQQSVMVHRINELSDPRWNQGEWVVYRLPGNGMMNLDRILARPGDSLRFHKDTFEVNGRLFEKVSSFMPDNEEMTMGPNTYFIWPSQASYNYGGEEQRNTLFRLSEINESQIIGRPYQRWFWKSVDLPPLQTLPSSMLLPTSHP